MRTLITGLILSLTAVSASFGVEMGEITCGETKSGAIVAVSQEGTFTFAAQAGQRVIIDVETTSGPLNTYILLYSPSGDRVAEQSNDFLDYLVQESGTYTIIIRDSRGDRTGDYTITFLNIQESCCREITCDDTLQDTIDQRSDMDCFTFAAQAGQRVIIDVETTSGSLNTFILLYSPSGDRVAEQSNDFLDYLVQESGTYTIIIRDDGGDRTGDYTITYSNSSGCPGRSDLLVRSLSALPNPVVQPNQSVITWTVKNQSGNGVIPASFWFKVWLSLDNVFDATDDLIGETQISALNLANEYSGSFKLDSHLYSLGDYYIVAKVDATNVVLEESETNNSSSIPFTILPPETIYVDDTAAGANNGTSWTNAYIYLQDAIAYADALQTPVEIRVAQGIYVPDRTTANPDGTGDRSATFQLINSVIVNGGYAGIAGSDPDARDVITYETILSGDLLGDDTGDGPALADNSLHVVTASQTDATAVLDGFTIMAGNADANDPDHAGGGLLVIGGNPMISNCVFLANQAGWSGGGAFCQDSGVKFSGCTFVGNTAAHGGGLYHLSAQDAVVEDSLFAVNQCTYEGGALALDGGNARISACKFQENVASWSGGAISAHPAEVESHTITHCEFIANTALGKGINQGGGAVMDRGNETGLSHCIFQGNRSFGNPEEQSGLGGAVYCNGAATNLINCTFAGNFANAGHALACDTREVPGSAITGNCILWDGGEEIWTSPDSTVGASYSNIQTMDSEIYPGIDNINIDPHFALSGYWSDPNDPNLPLDPHDPLAVWIDGDYHLMSVEGRWEPVNQSWVADEYMSPCIDAGDPNSDWADEPTPNGGRINMGAYGGAGQASLTSEYNLRISSTTGGYVAEPGEGIFLYERDTLVGIDAVANTCYRFVGWTGTAVEADKVADANAASTTVTVDAAYTLTANFELTMYALTISSTEGGSVTEPGEGVFYYGCGTEPLTAVPSDANHVFVGWTGTAVETGKITDANTPSTSIAIDDLDPNGTLVAKFEPIPRSLEIVTRPGGSTTPDAGISTYPHGTAVDVVATPDSCSHFVNWTGTGAEAGRVADVNAATTTILVDADYTLIANFEPNEYVLTLSSGDGGSVTDPNEGPSPRKCNDIVLVTATPEPCYHFVNWTGTAVDAGKVVDVNLPIITVTIDSDYTLIADFELDKYELTLSPGTGGSVTTPGEGTFPHRCNESVPIVATADEGYYFVNWTGKAEDVRQVEDPDSASTTVTVNGDHSLKANFDPNTYILSYSPGPNGSISGDTPQEVIHGSNGTEVTAVPDARYHFVNWSDGSTANPRTDTNVTAHITVTANFAINPYKLTTSSTLGGSVTTPGEETKEYPHGHVVELVAAADPNHHFLHWTGPAVDDGKVGDPTSASTTVTITTDTSVMAVFKPDPNTVEDVVDSSDGQPETYFLPPGIDDDSIWNAENGKYYRGYFRDWGWTHTFSPPAVAPESINWATLKINAFDVDPARVHLIYGDGVLLGQLAARDDRWHSTTFDLGPDALAELMDGTMDIWMDIGTKSTVWRVALRSSALTVNYNPIIEGN